MRSVPTTIPGVVIIEPDVYRDSRGFFLETYHADKYLEAGIPGPFVQDNHSRSVRGTLRGLHLQIRHPQGKLVRVIEGEVFDVAVDLRRSSATFGRHVAITLSAENRRMLFIPPGFAHGFLVVSESAEFLYKTTDYWYPEHERTLLWNDTALGIAWPAGVTPALAAKDAAGVPLAAADCYS